MYMHTHMYTCLHARTHTDCSKIHYAPLDILMHGFHGENNKLKVPYTVSLCRSALPRYCTNLHIIIAKALHVHVYTPYTMLTVVARQ